jgi:hypothetical protein
MLFCGWDLKQWRAIREWAGYKPNTIIPQVGRAGNDWMCRAITGMSMRGAFDLRQRWLESGGPMNGPRLFV